MMVRDFLGPWQWDNHYEGRSISHSTVPM
ncbi:hypothetical protein Bhyg_11718 [Pseudolycoriella hygida]|uniref:Uncharacterized protein n=1 Tax=Pseudolycoriella hygida TaxID=35572 RepID=A0A9Q0MW37_9DIPT|nr:hypothetical protein Bhyg_11718 [Pseudolycoriella hygida]